MEEPKNGRVNSRERVSLDTEWLHAGAVVWAME
jgi:hypothetical protein